MVNMMLNRKVFYRQEDSDSSDKAKKLIKNAQEHEKNSKSFLDRMHSKYSKGDSALMRLAEEVNDHPFAGIRNPDDCQLLAKFMLEKNYLSFNEYLQHCSEVGKSLLTEPYEYYQINKTREVRVMETVNQEKQVFSRLDEELEHDVRQAKLAKRHQRMEKEQQRLQQQYEEKKQRRLKLQQDFLNNQRLEQRKIKRRIGIEQHRRELRRELEIMEVKEEYAPQPEQQNLNVTIDQSELHQQIEQRKLKPVRVRVQQMILEAYSDAKNQILNEIETKRRLERERKEKLKQERLLMRPKTIQEQAGDLARFNYSLDSLDSAYQQMLDERMNEQLLKAEVPQKPIKIPVVPVPLEYVIDNLFDEETDQEQSQEPEILLDNGRYVLAKGVIWFGMAVDYTVC